MRFLFRVLGLLWAANLFLITLILGLSRQDVSKPVSSWLLYTTQTAGGYTAINRVSPVHSAPHQLNADFIDVWFPSWSPDGQWIAFFAAGEVRQGRMVPDFNTFLLYRMRADGSDLQQVAADTTRTGTPINLSWSPDGRYLIWDSFLGETVDSGSGQTRFASEKSRLDLKSRQIERQQIDQPQAWVSTNEDAWTQNGLSPTFTMLPQDAVLRVPLSPIRVDGWEISVRIEADPPGIYRNRVADPSKSDLLFKLSDQLLSLAASPDNRTIVFSTLGPGGGKVYRLDVPAGHVKQLVRDTAIPYHVMNLAWSPDGRWITVEAHERYSGAVYLLPMNDTQLLTLNELPPLVTGPDQNGNMVWSPPVHRPFRWPILIVIGLTGLAVAKTSQILFHRG